MQAFSDTITDGYNLRSWFHGSICVFANTSSATIPPKNRFDGFVRLDAPRKQARLQAYIYSLFSFGVRKKEHSKKSE